MSTLMDLTGQTFGRLTVVERAEDYVRPNGQRGVRWLCKCSCKEDKYVAVLGQLLRSGKTRSCGCLHNEELSMAKKKYNNYDLSGEYGIGYTSKDEEFLFDLEDYEKIRKFCWFVQDNGYVSAYNPDKNSRILLHRLIMNCDDSNLYVDHKHGEKSKRDNRKSNLRIVTSSQNGMNKDLLPNNTSGITGVSWNKRKQKWESYITINNKKINLGKFIKFEDAVTARKEAEEKYFGEFSYDNSRKGR